MTSGDEAIEDQRIGALLAATTERFSDLLRLGAFEPSFDFVGADLRWMDFRGEDLGTFDLRWADLRHCSFEGARFIGARLDGAQFDADVRLRLDPRLEIAANDPAFDEVARFMDFAAQHTTGVHDLRVQRSAEDRFLARFVQHPEVGPFARDRLARGWPGDNPRRKSPPDAESRAPAARTSSDPDSPTLEDVSFMATRTASSERRRDRPAPSDRTLLYVRLYDENEPRIRLKAAKLLAYHERRRAKGATALQEDADAMISYAWLILLRRSPDFADHTGFLYYFFRRMENYCRQAFRRADAQGLLHEELDPDHVTPEVSQADFNVIQLRPDIAAERQSEMRRSRRALVDKRPDLVGLFDLFVAGILDVGRQATHLQVEAHQIYDMRERLRRFLAQVDLDT